MIRVEEGFYKSGKIVEQSDLIERINMLRKGGKSIGVCTGGFDFLHPGHMTHLASAKKYCDILVVSVAHDSLNAQRSGYKGRPIFSEKVRAYSVSQLKSVDLVVLNDDVKEIIELIKPNYYFRGLDYLTQYGSNPDFASQVDLMHSLGGKIIYTQDEKLSTTHIIDYVKREIKPSP